MRAVAVAGYPVPRVHRAAGRDLVMDLVGGPTLLESLARGDVAPAAGGALLAALHAELHRVPAPPGTLDLARADASGRGVAPGRHPVVLHLDLHPGNVVLSPRGPVVIDWTNARGGPAALDRAVTAHILAEVAVAADAGDPSMPRGVGPLARGVLEAYVDAVGQVEPAAADRASVYRGADPSLEVASRRRIPDARKLLAETDR